jgi:hypothetical protein
MEREEPGDWFPYNNQWVGRDMGSPCARRGWSRSPWAGSGKPTHTYHIKSYISYESQTYPNSCLSQIPLRDKIPQKILWGCWGAGVLFFSWIFFKLTRGSRPYLQEEIVSPIPSLWVHSDTKLSELLSSTVKVSRGDLGCSWRSCSCFFIIWVLKAFIWKREIWFRRHEPNMNNDRNIRSGLAWSSRKDNFSSWKVTESLRVNFFYRFLYPLL